MNKFLKVSWIATAASAALPVLALAQTLPPSPAVDIGGVWTLVCRIFGYLFYALVLATIFFVILAAFKYLTASGDPEKVKAASHQLLYAAIAIIVGILARVLPGIAASLVGVSGVGAC
jgi:hypothetical protein